MRHKTYSLLLGFFVLSISANAAVLPQYATNNYTNHPLNRSEKKCIEEGYKVTYATCTDQTAPIDRCPHNDTYYRSCSQEQWCRNNNFTFLKLDCKLPTYPLKICDNKYPIYRTCQENISKACEDAGYSSPDKCQLTEERCPYNSDYGKCCNACPDFSHDITAIPVGFVAAGPTCTTCDGITKTNIIENPCEGHNFCQYGPLSDQTPSCIQGTQTLYTECKTVETHCKENGYTQTSCATTEDALICPEYRHLKKCQTNCHKVASSQYPDADIISQSSVNPMIDMTKNAIRSTFGQISPECTSQERPEVTLNITDKNYEIYSNLFDRNISNINFIINFETSLPLSANGTLENVRVVMKGDIPECPFQGNKLHIKENVNFINVDSVCADIEISESSKFTTSGHVIGNINMQKNSSLGIKGNLNGSINSQSYCDILIKGHLKNTLSDNSYSSNQSIVFGCSSRAKIESGIDIKTSDIILKQRAVLDVPHIKLTSTSDNPNLTNTLSSIHLHRYSRMLTVYDNTEYPLVDNNEIGCDDKYYTHLGSAVDLSKNSITIEPSELLSNKWTCQELTRKQLECN